jgi:ATP-dependent exoDNAse (exonuclease V) beta subunit
LTPDKRLPWELINDADRLEELSSISPHAVSRLNVLRDVMAAALESRGDLDLRELVERTWLRLNGPVCITAQSAIADAEAYLDLLEDEARQQSGGGDVVDLPRLEARLEKLFSTNAQSIEATTARVESPVQIMTIHKAKGLEFDVVIVPGLHRTPRNEDRRLLVWSEQADPNSGMRELLLAPIREVGDDDGDEIYRYVASLERAKQLHEDVRLLYVAATRAERALHLLATLVICEKDGAREIAAPRSGSLLAAMWPAASCIDLPDADAALERGSRPIRTAESTINRNLPQRLGSKPVAAAFAQHEWLLHPNTASPVSADETQPIEFDWASDTVRHAGTIVHAMMQRIAEDGLASWHVERVDEYVPYFDEELSRRGVGSAARTDVIPRIIQALHRTLRDSRGRWILSDHQQAQAEWRLTGVTNGVVVNVAIDRTFVDEDGVRWIIDFKTGSHEGADIDAFLDNEVRRYRPQLDRYAQLVRSLSREESAREVRLALYFPMLNGWREWH